MAGVLVRDAQRGPEEAKAEVGNVATSQRTLEPQKQGSGRRDPPSSKAARHRGR